MPQPRRRLPVNAVRVATKAAAAESAATHVALLRGINVGGKHMVPMVHLAAAFESLGCTAVKTLLQSGNVVFRAPTAARSAAALTKRIETLLCTRFGFDVPVVLRTALEMQAVLHGNAFPHAATTAVSVAFLATAPAATRVAALDPQRSPGDAFVVKGREVYLHLPNGAARSKLTTAWLDSALQTTSTVRSVQTVQRLAECCTAP